MGWVRIDDNAPHHRKMLEAGPAACWLWVCGLAYCQRMCTDGLIPFEALSTLGVRNWKKLAGFLLTARLWDHDADGYRVHDYLSMNATREQRHEKQSEHRDRMAKWRQRKRDMSQPPHGDTPVTRHTESDVTPLPSTPLPSTNPRAADPTCSTPSEGRASSLIMSPARFAKLRDTHAFVGSRLRVPNVLHDELRAKLGGESPTVRLVSWYVELNIELEASGEPIPDIFAWMRPRFAAWVRDAASDAELEKFRPEGA